MSTLKILVLVVAGFLCMLLLAPVALYAQEWSPAQKEVWNTVEKMWEMSAKGDVEGELSYCDNELSLWVQNDPLPIGKSSFKKWTAFNSKTEQTLIQELRPVAIKVFPDFAFAHYYVTAVTKAGPGEKGGQGSLRITDIFRKKGDTWFWVGGHNSNVPQTW